MSYMDQKPEHQHRHIKENPDITPRNQNLILKFDRDLGTENYSDRRRYKLLSILKKYGEQANFNLDKADEDNLRDLVAWSNSRNVAEATKLDYRKALKRFYRWINNRIWGNKDEHPDMTEFIDTSGDPGNGKLPKDLLTPEDVDNLIEAAKNYRDKALIALLWDSGARYGELMDLTVGDLEDREHGKKVVVDGKTGSRRIPLRESVPHLNRWLNVHPSKGDRDAYLFCKFQNPYETPSHYYVNSKVLTNAAEDAEIKKPSNPHHFRHSRASFLANRFTEAQLCEWFGWVQGSDVPAKYVHLSGRDIDKAFNQLHGIEEEEKTMEDRTQECPRCKEINNPEARFCSNCGQAFDLEAAERLEENEEKLAREADQEQLDKALDVLEVEEHAKREALKTLLENVD